MNVFKREHQDLVIVVLRFAVGAVFLWFGVDKWIHPQAWYGWVPSWVLSRLPMGVDAFLWWNGAFEFVIGILLVAGRALRGTAAVSGLFMLAITATVGANEVSVRDAALVGSCLALFIHANAKAKKPVPANTVSLICSLYVFYLFVYGVMYLKSGA